MDTKIPTYISVILNELPQQLSNNIYDAINTLLKSHKKENLIFMIDDIVDFKIEQNLKDTFENEEDKKSLLDDLTKNFLIPIYDNYVSDNEDLSYEFYLFLKNYLCKRTNITHSYLEYYHSIVTLNRYLKKNVVPYDYIGNLLVCIPGAFQKIKELPDNTLKDQAYDEILSESINKFVEDRVTIGDVTRIYSIASEVYEKAYSAERTILDKNRKRS